MSKWVVYYNNKGELAAILSQREHSSPEWEAQMDPSLIIATSDDPTIRNVSVLDDIEIVKLFIKSQIGKYWKNPEETN